ncbi:ATP-binding protein [Flavobacterium sp. J27]|uniref:tetratricopeptide repeat-containing sensor histidine kinase n=1 Tax=Flavobacterium sp. J27 TaxID=2060419 RepID=UPI0013EE940A|nr:ATP-binding protein [Flavobacterium sp. J27]
MKHFPFLFLFLLFISCDNFKNNLLNNKDEYETLKKKGYDKFMAEDYDSSYFYFDQARIICNSNNPNDRIYPMLFLADIQKIKSDFNGVEETVTEALKISENSNFNSNLYNLLGISYEEKLDYDKAIKNYRLSLKNTSSEKYKIIIKNNIGVIYLKKGNYSKTIQILEPLLKLDTLKKHREDYARVIDNLGFAYFNLKQKKKAYFYISKSLNIRDSIGDEYEKLAPLMHLSRFFMDSIPSESNKFATNAYEIATKVNSPDDRLEALDILIRNSSETRQFKKYYDKFSSLKDSIEFIRQTTKNQFANIKYNSDKAIKEKEKERVQKERLGISLILFMIISTLIFFLIRSKNKREKLKIAYTTETRISKRLHDELANDVFNTITFIDTQDLQNPNNKETILQDLDAIYDKARNISKQTSEITTGKAFAETLNQLFISYTSEHVNVMVQGLTSIDWENINENKQIEIYRVLNELLVNMKKHSKANLVLIRFESVFKNIQIKYSDNGKGFEKEKVFKNGLLNVENRILSIKGKITFDSEINKGVKVNIEFPK